MPDQLTPLDATFLELEQADPSAHMHIGAVLVFGPTEAGAPALDRLRRQTEERLDALAHYRCRLSSGQTGGLRWPHWEIDPDFAIGDHVHRAALPSPGGRRELIEWAADYWSSRLDRGGPLWDVVLLEGLESGGWALCTKTHHALVDGIGSIDVAHLLLDTEPDPEPQKWEPRPPPEPEESHLVPAWIRGIESAMAGGVRTGVDTALHPSKLAEALSRSKALAEVLVRDEVKAAPKTSINVPLGTTRRYDVVTADLDQLKEVKNALGGTVNDVVLAVVSGGLRALLEHRGEMPPEAGLRAMVPVNVRVAGEHLALGNRITSLFMHLPVAESDPMRRYVRAVEEAESLKSGSQATGSAAMIDLAGLAPPVVHSVLAQGLFASRLFNVTVTNVPGPTQRLYAFGAPMEALYPLVPLAADHAVGVAIVSYAGSVVFGVIADRRAVPDLDVLCEGISTSLAELTELAGAYG